MPSTGRLEGGRKHAGREPQARGRWSGWQTSCLLSLEISSQEHELCQHWGSKPSQQLFGELSFPALPQTKGAFADLFTGDGRHLPHRSRSAGLAFSFEPQPSHCCRAFLMRLIRSLLPAFLSGALGVARMLVSAVQRIDHCVQWELCQKQHKMAEFTLCTVSPAFTSKLLLRSLGQATLSRTWSPASPSGQ